MQGIVFLGDKKLEIQDFDDPSPGPDDVIIEIKASGMCGSDLKFYRANNGPSSLGLGGDDKPVIAGHEPCGTIVEIGSNVPKKTFQLDTRVMQHHYEGCGTCSHCSTGWQQLCIDGVKVVFGVTGHGAHSKYMKCPANTLVHLRDEISFVAGAAISCGTGTAWGALKRLDLKASQTIAIFGMGPVGLSAVMLANKMGSRVIAIDINKQRLDRSAEFGADILINPNESNDLLEEIKDLTKGTGVDASLEASSSPEARSLAVKSVKTWGKACFVGEGGDVTLDVSNDLLRRQVTLIGSWTFSKHGQAQCADFIVDKKLNVDNLFTHTWSLNQAEEAYKIFDKQSDGKGVIIP